MGSVCSSLGHIPPKHGKCRKVVQTLHELSAKHYPSLHFTRWKSTWQPVSPSWGSVAGDGNCFWYCLLLLLNLDRSLQQVNALKLAILRPEASEIQKWVTSFGGTEHQLRTDLAVLERDCEWADWRAIGWAAYHLARPIVVVEPGMQTWISWSPTTYTGLPPFVMKLEKDHFSPLVEQTVSLEQIMSDTQHRQSPYPQLVGNFPSLAGGAVQPLPDEVLNPMVCDPEKAEWFYPVDNLPPVPTTTMDDVHLTILEVNATSMRRHLDELLSLNAHVIVITESRVPATAHEEIEAKVNRAGWSVLWGPGVPVRTASNGRRLPATTGVAILLRTPLMGTAWIEHPSLMPFITEGRLLPAIIHLPGGWDFLLVGVYADVSIIAENVKQRAKMWEAIYDMINTSGYQYWVIAGDLQQELSQIVPISTSVALGASFDGIDPHVQGRHPTCLQGAGSVIDHVVMSCKFWPHWREGGSCTLNMFPNHHPVYVTFAAKINKPNLERCVLAGPMPETALAPLPEEKDPLWQWSFAKEAFDTALESDDVNELVQTWSHRWEQLLVARAEAQGSLVPPSCLGRARSSPWRKAINPLSRATTSSTSMATNGLRSLLALLVAADYLERNDHEVPTLLQQRILVKWNTYLPEIDEVLSPGTSCHDAKILIQGCLEARQNKERIESRQRWKASLLKAGNPLNARSSAFVRSPEVKAFIGIYDDHQRLCADPAEQAALLEDYWSKIHTLPEGTGLFPADLIASLPKGSPGWQPAPLQAVDLAHAIASIKRASAAGPDSWRVCEVRSLPPAALRELASVCHRCDELCSYPELWTTALMTMIPKTMDGPKVSQLRPISVYSVLWRMAAKCKYQQLSDQYNSCLHPWQFGGRKGCNPVTPILEISNVIEKAQYGMTGHACGLSIDIEKMFDSIPVAAVAQVWRHWGVDEVCAAGLLGRFRQGVSRFRLAGGYVSRPHQGTRGTPQGCPVAVFAANTLMAAVAHAISRELENAHFEVLGSLYIDDLNLIFQDPAAIPVAFNAVTNVLAGLGMSVSKTKSFVWTTSAVLSRHWQVTTTPCALQQVHCFRILGAWFRLRGPPEADKLHFQQLLRICKQRAQRISHLPIGSRARGLVAAAMIPSKATYMPIGRWLTVDEEKSMNVQMTRAVKAGHVNNREAREIEYQVYRPAHRHHIETCRFIRLLALVQHSYSLDPVGTLMMLPFMQRRKLPQPTGVFSTLAHVLRRMGIALDATTLRVGSHQLPLLFNGTGMTYRQWQHEVRVFVRSRLSGLLSARRRSYEGIEAGIDKKRTLQPKQGGHFDAWCPIWHMDGLLFPMRKDPGAENSSCRTSGGWGGGTLSSPPPLFPVRFATR